VGQHLAGSRVEQVAFPYASHTLDNRMQQISFGMLVSQIRFVGIDCGADAACGRPRG
jgi:hypothetical protein